MKKVIFVLALVGFAGSAFANDVQKTKTSAETTVEKSQSPSTEAAAKEVTVKSAATKEESSHKVQVKKGEHGKMIKKTVEQESKQAH